MILYIVIQTVFIVYIIGVIFNIYEFSKDFHTGKFQDSYKFELYALSKRFGDKNAKSLIVFLTLLLIVCWPVGLFFNDDENENNDLDEKNKKDP